MGSPLGPTLANAFLDFHGEKNGLQNALLNLNQFFIEDMLMIFLLYSNQLITSKNFLTTLILVTRICPFHLRKKKMVKCPVQMQKFHEKTVNFSQLFTANLLLVVFILISRAFYLLHTNLVCFMSQYIDVLLYAQSGQNFIDNL